MELGLDLSLVDPREMLLRLLSFTGKGTAEALGR